MFKLPFFIAKRYLFSKKSTQAINIIAGVSLVGFAIGVFAMVVVLSTMNGFEKLVFGMYNDFSPSVRIAAKNGKTIAINPDLEKHLNTIKTITWSRVLEENASCQYGDFHYIARIKGVEPNYIQQANLEVHLRDGELPTFKPSDSFYGVLGLGVDYRLGTRIEDPNCMIVVNAPRRGNFNLNSLASINQKSLKPVGVFEFDDAINSQYILTNLAFAQQLFERKNSISSYELYTIESEEKLKDQLFLKYGNQYQIDTRFTLHKGLFKMFKTEKWFTFIILAFVLLIVSFNLTGSLSLLVLEKKQDIKIMKSIGFTNSQIRQIFFNEGMLIALIGGAIGLALGLFFCWAQIQFGFIKIAGAIVESYPMQIRIYDVVLCLITVFIIGFLSSIYPALQSSKGNA